MCKPAFVAKVVTHLLNRVTHDERIYAYSQQYNGHSNLKLTQIFLFLIVSLKKIGKLLLEVSKCIRL